METFKSFLESTIPPGMEQWVQDNEQSFMQQHGGEYKPYLLSAAWTIYRRIYREPGLDLQ